MSCVLLFDQVPRNIFRGTPRAYAYDRLAYPLARALHARADFASLPAQLRYMTVICIVHSEKLEDQERVVAFAESLPMDTLGVTFRAIGRNHRDRIALFGRFPERNKYLGRVTTDSERVYMESIYADA